MNFVLEWSDKVESRLVQEIKAGRQILFIYLLKQFLVDWFRSKS